jgi:hypothetical protein
MNSRCNRPEDLIFEAEEIIWGILILSTELCGFKFLVIRTGSSVFQDLTVTSVYRILLAFSGY